MGDDLDSSTNTKELTDDSFGLACVLSNILSMYGYSLDGVIINRLLLNLVMMILEKGAKSFFPKVVLNACYLSVILIMLLFAKKRKETDDSSDDGDGSDHKG